MADLREWMSFEPSYIQKVVCEDELDVQIITCLMQKGVGGILPSFTLKEALHRATMPFEYVHRAESRRL